MLLPCLDLPLHTTPNVRVVNTSRSQSTGLLETITDIICELSIVLWTGSTLLPSNHLFPCNRVSFIPSEIPFQI